jgi:bis(5'-adenosyl)-triphosphatase
MENCPFCKSSIKQVAFVESENFLAIYNRSPILPGHSLIIPRDHYQRLLDVPPILLAEMMEFSTRAVRILMMAFKAEAFDWTIQDGAAAGQTVPHLHLHLIPRLPNDLSNPGDWFIELEKSNIDSGQRRKLTMEEMIEIVEYISRFKE